MTLTPQQKAVELIKKYSPYMYSYMGSGMLTNTEDPTVILSNAKQCAIICVDEVLISMPLHPSLSSNVSMASANASYWNEVKQELNKM